MDESKIAWCLGFCLLVIVPGSLPAGTQMPDGTVQGNERIDAPWVGVSFQVPEGFRGGYDVEAGAVILKDIRQETMIAMFGASEGDLDTIGELAVEAVSELGINLVPRSLTRPDRASLDAIFAAWVDNQPRSVIGTVRQGGFGAVVAILALGGPGQEGTLKTTVDDIGNSLQWSQPQVQGWREKLAGKVLYRSGGDSAGRTGSDGGYSYASSTKTQIDLCSNGQYGLQSESESFLATPGASMPSTSRTVHYGHWWLVADLGGAAYLYLETGEGQYYLWPVSETAEGANVNGLEYSVSNSQRCR
jgi:hypothetical protein